jgi:hypothetical protein
MGEGGPEYLNELPYLTAIDFRPSRPMPEATIDCAVNTATITFRR